MNARQAKKLAKKKEAARIVKDKQTPIRKISYRKAKQISRTHYKALPKTINTLQIGRMRQLLDEILGTSEGSRGVKTSIMSNLRVLGNKIAYEGKTWNELLPTIIEEARPDIWRDWVDRYFVEAVGYGDGETDNTEKGLANYTPDTEFGERLFKDWLESWLVQTGKINPMDYILAR